MSEKPAILLKGLGKRYTLYSSRLVSVADALGLSWLLPGRQRRLRHFWALRNINLTLPRGARIGIIGRNGAGKSTLLKLITRNVSPTEGEIHVNGDVQALLQAGTGMHPEFTGHENIEAALTYQGLSTPEIRDAVADIVDFTELGPFLDQPFKTYSTGMQARLAFATATVIKPDILIIDEVLGVGDGYFLSKSTERMKKLIDGGASVLLVTHSLEQILRFCDQAIWIDRGQIVRHGDALEVVKEYDTYLHVLEERRLKAANANRQCGPASNRSGDVACQYTAALRLRFRVAAPNRLRVGEVVLLENDRQQERLHIGGPQDGAPGNAAVLCLEPGNSWSAPERRDSRMCRALSASDHHVCGDAVFSLYLFDASVTYSFEIEYSLRGEPVEVQVIQDAEVIKRVSLPPTSDWQRIRLDCPGHQSAIASSDQSEESVAMNYQRWPGLGGLRVEKVRMLGARGGEQAVFAFGDPMTIEIQFRAHRTDTFPFRPALTMFRRSDGVRVTNQIGPPEQLTLTAGMLVTVRLHLGPLRLGNGTYMFSIGLYRQLDLMEIDPPEWYDLLERNFEFQVHGRESVFGDIFHHPGEWRIEQAQPALGLKSA
jgi:lipopolysaccharide transport system ATP-binding protein